MTKKEMAEIIAIMQSNYPDDFKGMSDNAMNGKINLWLMQFRDDQYSDVLAAVMAALWPPRPGLAQLSRAHCTALYTDSGL